MSNFEIDISSLARNSNRPAPFLGTLCRNSSTCVTCRALRGHRAGRTSTSTSFRQAESEMRRVRRMFVNAIDRQEEAIGFPVRIMMLPFSVFNELITQVRGLNQIDPNINVFHPDSGRWFLIRKQGIGLQTRYTVRVGVNNDRIPNDDVYRDIITHTIDGQPYVIESLFNLTNIPDLWFNLDGHLQQGSPIVRLKEGHNWIRILPPYNNTRRIHTELGFHYMTLQDYNARMELEDALEDRQTTNDDEGISELVDQNMQSYNPILPPTTGRTRVQQARDRLATQYRRSTEVQQRPHRRELMLPNEEEGFQGGGLRADNETDEAVGTNYLDEEIV